MNFTEWISLTPAERELERHSWHVFEPGYWHSIAYQAAAHFAREFASRPQVKRIFKSLYHGEELIVAVQTELSPAPVANLPESYAGFRVLQFAGRTPDGVLVDVHPATESLTIAPARLPPVQARLWARRSMRSSRQKAKSILTSPSGSHPSSRNSSGTNLKNS